MKITVSEYCYDNSNKVFYELYMVNNECVLGRLKLNDSHSKCKVMGMKGMLLEIMNIDVKYVRKGIGGKLIKAGEKMMKKRGMDYSLLYCLKDSWMEKWYIRLGYKYYMEHDEKNNWYYKMLK